MNGIFIRAQTDTARAETALSAPLTFGRTFADLMLLMKHSTEEGWHDAAIQPFGPLPLSPASKVLHYSFEVFEGHKAYRTPDGGVAMFRPEQNCRRLNRSTKRMRMPTIPIELQLEALDLFVDAVRAWVPQAAGHSLYLRPAVIGTEATLGVAPGRDHLYFVIASPVGLYFTSPDGIALRVEEEHIRAAPGGVGSAKTGGNYAAGLDAQERAHEAGFDQVLWLDARERRWIEELNAMNFFAVIEGRLVTPPVGDTILDGIVRRSLLELAPSIDIPIDERPISIDELVEGLRSNRVTEIFAAGTAAVVTAVSSLGFRGERLTVGTGTTGPVTRRLKDQLTGIQEGRLADHRGWMREVPHFAAGGEQLRDGLAKAELAS